MAYSRDKGQPMRVTAKQVKGVWHVRVHCSHNYKAKDEMSEKALMASARHIASKHPGHFQDIRGL